MIACEECNRVTVPYHLEDQVHELHQVVDNVLEEIAAGTAHVGHTLSDKVDVSLDRASSECGTVLSTISSVVDSISSLASKTTNRTISSLALSIDSFLSELSIGFYYWQINNGVSDEQQQAQAGTTTEGAPGRTSSIEDLRRPAPPRDDTGRRRDDSPHGDSLAAKDSFLGVATGELPVPHSGEKAIVGPTGFAPASGRGLDGSEERREASPKRGGHGAICCPRCGEEIGELTVNVYVQPSQAGYPPGSEASPPVDFPTSLSNPVPFQFYHAQEPWKTLAKQYLGPEMESLLNLPTLAEQDVVASSDLNKGPKETERSK